MHADDVDGVGGGGLRDHLGDHLGDPRLREIEVTGPIANGSRPNAFGAPVLDLGPHGYTAEEYFIAGEATAYEPAAGTELGRDGRWSLLPARIAPFKTRLLVVRPASAADFSGTVWVSWLNVTAGFEIGDVTPENVRDGDAVVYVSAQRIGHEGRPGAEANGLKAWDPQRYGSLSHPGDEFSYDIFTKAALVVGRQRGNLSVDPLPGFAVERVLATGASQSGARLNSYLNGVQPIEQALDGVLLVASFGWVTQVEKLEDDPGTVESTVMGSARIRDDLDIPAIHVTTETEAAIYYSVRQPDSDRFRTWEVAGGSHAGGAGGFEDVMKVFLRDELTFGEGGTLTADAPPSDAGEPDAADPDATGPAAGEPEILGSDTGAVASAAQPNVLPWAPVHAAARRALVAWVRDGVAPPSFVPITFAGDPATIERDSAGNALGGVRMPELDVPVATYRGVVDGAPLLASLFGTMIPFASEELQARYPSRTVYLKAYDEAVDRAVEAGSFNARDADAIKAAAGTRADELFA